jgi:DNA-binding NtrC family response regulator
MPSNRATILIVEDNDDIRAMWAMIFSKFGMDVIPARTIREACSRASEVGITIDAMLVDYKLPDGCGTKLITLLGSKLPKVRILVSGYKLTHPGFSECFTKPVDIYTMYEVVRSKLEECYATCA